MPQQINSSTDFFVSVEGDIAGADNTKNGSSSGNASTQPNLSVGYYNATPPTVTDGNPAAFQLDSNGRLLINLAVALPAGTNNIGDVDVVTLPDVTIGAALPTGTNSIGQVTANAGTDLNTSALALESGGNLATLAGTVAGSAVQVNPSTRTVRYATGTLSTSGDSAPIVDVSAVPGYAAGDRIVITALRIQNENGTANTVIIKDGATNVSRVYTESRGSGLDRQYALGRELRLSADTDLILNLSAANSVGYSVEYFLEA